MIVIYDKKGFNELLCLHTETLRDADLTGANLFEANLVQCDLRGANLRDARLSDAVEVDSLRDVAYNDVAQEVGQPGYKIPLTLPQRMLAAIA